MKRLRRSSAEALATIGRTGIRIEFGKEGDVIAAYTPGSHYQYNRNTIGSFVRRGWLDEIAVVPLGYEVRLVVKVADYRLSAQGHVALDAA